MSSTTLFEDAPGEMQQIPMTSSAEDYAKTKAGKRFIKEFLSGYLGGTTNDSLKSNLSSLMNILNDCIPSDAAKPKKWERTEWRRCNNGNGLDQRELPPVDVAIGLQRRSKRKLAELKKKQNELTVFQKISKANSYLYEKMVAPVKGFLDVVFCEGPVERTAKLFDYTYDMLRTILTMDFEVPLVAKTEQLTEPKSFFDCRTIDEPIMILFDRIALIFYYITQPSVRKAYNEFQNSITKQKIKRKFIEKVVERLMAEPLNGSDPHLQVINESHISIGKSIRIHISHRECKDTHLQMCNPKPTETSSEASVEKIYEPTKTADKSAAYKKSKEFFANVLKTHLKLYKERLDETSNGALKEKICETPTTEPLNAANPPIEVVNGSSIAAGKCASCNAPYKESKDVPRDAHFKKHRQHKTSKGAEPLNAANPPIEVVNGSSIAAGKSLGFNAPNKESEDVFVDVQSETSNRASIKQELETRKSQPLNVADPSLEVINGSNMNAPYKKSKKAQVAELKELYFNICNTMLRETSSEAFSENICEAPMVEPLNAADPPSQEIKKSSMTARKPHKEFEDIRQHTYFKIYNPKLRETSSEASIEIINRSATSAGNSLRYNAPYKESDEDVFADIPSDTYSQTYNETRSEASMEQNFEARRAEPLNAADSTFEVINSSSITADNIGRFNALYKECKDAQAEALERIYFKMYSSTLRETSNGASIENTFETFMADNLNAADPPFEVINGSSIRTKSVHINALHKDFKEVHTVVLKDMYFEMYNAKLRESCSESFMDMPTQTSNQTPYQSPFSTTTSSSYVSPELSPMTSPTVSPLVTRNASSAGTFDIEPNKSAEQLSNSSSQYLQYPVLSPSQVKNLKCPKHIEKDLLELYDRHRQLGIKHQQEHQ